MVNFKILNTYIEEQKKIYFEWDEYVYNDLQCSYHETLEEYHKRFNITDFFYELEDCELTYAEKIKICQNKEKMRIKENSFRQNFWFYIQNSGMSEREIYTKACISKVTFLNMKNNENYEPKRDTVIQICFAMKLSLEETQGLLACAKFILAGNDIRDDIFMFCLSHKIYDFYEINAYIDLYNERIGKNMKIEYPYIGVLKKDAVKEKKEMAR